MITAKDAAQITGAKISGDENQVINSLANIGEASEGELTFLGSTAYAKYFETTKASVIFVNRDFNKTRSDITYLEVDDPTRAFYTILIKCFSPDYPLSGISKTAYIDPSAVIGENTAIGMNAVIPAGCKIGKNTKIFHNTVLGENVEIGDNCLIFQNVSIRENCRLGNKIILHPGVVIGSDGFGFTRDANGYPIKLPQIGNVIIEDDVEIGANCAVDRGALKSTIIRKGVKLDNLVQIAHNVVIGENTAISAQSGVAGSTVIGKNVIVAGQVGIADHLTVTDNVIFAAKTGVSKSITKPGVYFGYPVKEQRKAQIIEAHIRTLPEYAEKIKKLEEKVKELEAALSSK